MHIRLILKKRNGKYEMNCIKKKTRKKYTPTHLYDIAPDKKINKYKFGVIYENIITQIFVATNFIINHPSA